MITLPVQNAFDIPGDIVYLNCASLSPQLRSVTEAGSKAVQRKASPWQIQASDWFSDSEDPRALVTRRFDMGEFSNFISLPMAKQALSQVLDWGVANIQSALKDVTAAIQEKAAMLGMRYPAFPGRVGHMIGIDFPGGMPEAIKGELSANNIFVGFRGQSIRVSPYLYTRESDIEKLFSVIRNCL